MYKHPLFSKINKMLKKGAEQAMIRANTFTVNIHANLKDRTGSRLVIATPQGETIYEARFTSTATALEALARVRAASIEALIAEEGQA